ncbi:hypothetical protein [Methylobacterium nodulans]|uniref:Uncharacterized protein n=1 Tax=Methylobacterium nodulans (strain LMG 21967 / CNCM I-2342 / ORS 2060) TaxID=460265 RepID=B8IVH8_METNO|nr:hypothetical protein [Methylobacterium nodulans]ACL62418.1 hypothetical protein Mnod_8267 [Methylobacterium nodulans ORS 2060]
MDWIGPAVVAAAVSGIVSTVGFVVNRATTLATHRERLTADRTLAERKSEFDKDLAERKFRYDRDLNDHKRGVELAETVLSDFYQMTAVLQEIRNSGALSNEWEERTPEPGETEWQAQNRNTYFVPLASIRRNSEFLSGMMSRRYRSKAMLGAEIDAAFQAVHEILVRVQVSAGTLMRLVDGSGEGRQRNQALRDRCEADIWMGAGDPNAPDQLAEQMEQAVAAAERVCQRIITGEGAA